MKTKELTQLELATLAAALPTGSAKERVLLAVEIWREAASEIPGTVENVHRRIERSDQLAADPVRLEWLLSELMPKSHLSKQLDEWEKFALWKMEHNREGIYSLPRTLSQNECDELGLPFGAEGFHTFLPEDELTKADLQALTKQALTCHDRDGVRNFLRISKEFMAWQSSHTKRTVSESKKPGAGKLWHVTKPALVFAKSKSLTFDEIVKRNGSILKMKAGTAQKWAQTWKDCGDIEEISPGKFALRS